MTKTIKTAIIPVAGLGTRFLPVTKAQPKEMLPLIDKPVIQYVVEEAVNSGIENIIFVTGRNKRAIEDYFDYAPEIELKLISNKNYRLLKEIRAISKLANFAYVRQKEPLGSGHALLCASHLIKNEPFAVLFADDVIDSRMPCLEQMINIFKKHKSPVIALEKVNKKDVEKYGIIEGVLVEKNILKIKRIVEKPKAKDAPSNLAIVGRFILEPDIFEILKKLKPKKGKEITLSEALNELLKIRPVYGLKFKGLRYDCGSKIGYLKAIANFALKNKELKNEFKKFLKTFKI